jgi:hypothetical protein
MVGISGRPLLQRDEAGQHESSADELFEAPAP